MNELFILMKRIERKHKSACLLNVDGDGVGEVWLNGEEFDFNSIAELRAILYELVNRAVAPAAVLEPVT